MNSIKGTNAKVLIVDDKGIETKIKGIFETSIGDLVSVSYDPDKQPEIKGCFILDDPLNSDLEAFASACSNAPLQDYQKQMLRTIENRIAEGGPTIIIGSGGKRLSTALMALGLSMNEATSKINAFKDAICVVDDTLYDLSQVIKLRQPNQFEEYENEQPRNRDHGWYRKFDKCHGKRNKKLNR